MTWKGFEYWWWWWSFVDDGYYGYDDGHSFSVLQDKMKIVSKSWSPNYIRVLYHFFPSIRRQHFLSETKELFKGSSLGNNIGSSIQSAPGDKSTPALNRRRGDLRKIYWIIIYQVGGGVFFPPSTKAFIFITKAHRLYLLPLLQG